MALARLNGMVELKGQACALIIREVEIAILCGSPMAVAFYLVAVLSQPPSPRPVKHQSQPPNRYEHGRLEWCKNCSSSHNKPANNSKHPRDEDDRLVRAMELWFADPQDDRSDHRQEKEGILSQAIEGHQSPEVAEDNI